MEYTQEKIENLNEDETCFICYMTRDELLEDCNDTVNKTSCCNKYLCEPRHTRFEEQNLYDKCGYCRTENKVGNIEEVLNNSYTIFYLKRPTYDEIIRRRVNIREHIKVARSLYHKYRLLQQ